MKKLWCILLFLFLLSGCKAKEENLKNNMSETEESYVGIGVQANYDEIGDFCNGVAIVKKGNKYGYINEFGEEIVPCRYEVAYGKVNEILCVGQDGKYGYFDQEGKEITSCIYDDGWRYHVDGLIIVAKNNLYGCINLNGEEVVPFEYEYMDYIDNYLLIVKKNDKWSHINFENKIKVIENIKIIETDFYDVANFVENLAYVTKREGTSYTYGYINEYGEQITQCIYEDARNFSEGLAVVKKDGRFGYINREGKEVIACEYEQAYDFSEGLAAVKKDGKFGYINKYGEEVISCIYEAGGDFYRGLTEIKENGKVGIINNKGENVIPTVYDWIEKFKNDVAMVCKNGQYGYINEEGEEIIPCIYNELIYVSEPIVILKKDESINNEEFKYDEVYSFHEEGAVVCKNGKYGYINKKGDEIVGCIYEDAGYFSSGMAKVYKGENEQCFIDINGTELELKGYEYTAPYYSDGLLVVKKNDKYGYVNRDGKEVIPCIFELSLDFENGIAEVSKNGERLKINKKGKILSKYESLNYYEDIAIIEENGKYGYVNNNGEKICACYYDNVLNFREGLAVVGINNTYGIIDKQGNMVIPHIYNYIKSFENKIAIAKNANRVILLIKK